MGVTVQESEEILVLKLSSRLRVHRTGEDVSLVWKRHACPKLGRFISVNIILNMNSPIFRSRSLPCQPPTTSRCCLNIRSNRSSRGESRIDNILRHRN
jgi:hypothetical protein